ncbi:ABC transporter permease [Sulfitobacter mediterraneus]|jgi:peptide/nickel transport system permease protein|uniref:ABC transporter permease n=1 Tax=Sulfitobacter TaxID=60136 RepID=UPI001932133D|nr:MULTISPECIES: ABC transporter permease [Sulfitobacter]MBM1633919.1 ABC transporter permease [Sulfitobacter mediterraneus]MBM1641566.1 ABC transporter permease [Sulfitobacter mediterraneus]MBM1645783.1 ABC transporter permease [Sulfitobacter mediterraneus]MBM1649685.1 ABC transporter permease [Sulfitobacter mediterraneus]MBM1653852.1 ABC transporter permease [Sulfitobacter mediterraneus]
MLAYLVKRVFQAIAVMLVISLVGFAIQDNLGDPLRELVGQSVSEEVRQDLRDELGLNDSFFKQYTRFLGNALQGDLGTSYFFKEPALDVILKKLPATLELVLGATLIIVGFSVPLGVYTAIKPNTILSRLIMGISIVGISIPVFLTAILMIFVFSVEFGWLPSYGRGDVVNVFGYWDTNFATLDGWAHILLPSLALASIMLPLFVRLIRAEMMEVLQSEYVKYAKAKGIRPFRIYFVHALKNTLLPVITVGGVQIGTMVAYTILTETVFQWPGMGFMFLEAVNRVDTPLIVAYLIVVGFIFVLTNTVVDLIYGLVNPTVNLARMGA